MATSEQDTGTWKADRIVVVGLVLLCFLIYGQVLRFEFVSLDDNLYVYDNPFVTAGLNLVSLEWALFAIHSANWHPLTWISHMVDATLFGANPGWHHIVNVIFHAANSVLAYVVFKRLTGCVWKSAFVAALFAVHPVHVESVAWVSERKDVLSTLFWLLTMLAYLRWARGPGDGGRGVAKSLLSVEYLLIVLAFLFGLASKPMVVTLPFVLLLLDHWPLGRLNSIREVLPRVFEKIPLFLLSAASSYITIRAQSSYGAVASTSMVPLSNRLENAAVSYAKYIGMLFYPADLGVNYPYQFSLPAWQVVGSVVVLAGISALCLWQRTERPYLIVGWLWFVGTMVPVIGIVQVGSQPLADRYTYLPYFGLFIMIVWGAAELVRKLRLMRQTTAVVAGAVILMLSVTAFNQAAYWKDSYTLYKHSIDTGYANFITYHNMCAVQVGRAEFADAEANCRKAIAAEPRYVEAFGVLGMIYVGQKRSQDAVDAFRKAIEIEPNDPAAYSNLAVPLMVLGETDEAQRSLDTAVELYRARGADPAYLAVAYSNLASVLGTQKNYRQAAEVLRRAVGIAPSRADIRANLAMMLYFENRTDDARTEIDRAISMNPNSAEIQNIYGMILLKQGDHGGAIQAFERAVQLKPELAEAKDNLEKARSAGK